LDSHQLQDIAKLHGHVGLAGGVGVIEGGEHLVAQPAVDLEHAVGVLVVGGKRLDINGRYDFCTFAKAHGGSGNFRRMPLMFG
jgi:hypothetical protein